MFPLCALLLCVPAVAFQSAAVPSARQRQSSESVITRHVSLMDVSEPPSRRRRLLPNKRRNTSPTASTVTAPAAFTSDPSALTFSGQIVKSSQPLVSNSAEERAQLIDFFKSTNARNTLFVSDAPPVPIHPVSPQLVRSWQAEAQRLGAALPDDSASDDQQTVMQLCSNGISFSGLVVETTVLCGAKLIPDAGEGLPAYEFTMIQDSTQARGPRLLMWIYNQVMGLVGNSNNNSRQKMPPKTTTSLCRIRLAEESNGGLGIHFESSFQVQMKLPSFLLKVLPVSKSRAEQQGSAAVTGFVQKGVVDSMQRFEQTFAEYQKQQSSSRKASAATSVSA